MKMELVLEFLKKLARNNNREWFEKNKSKYLEAKEVFDAFTASVLEEMIPKDESLAGLDPKKLVFRIYRDVRFSKDKTPYKKNMSAGFSILGKGMGKPGYYFQIEPGNKSFVAVGQFMPDAESLANIRQEIDYNSAAMTKLWKESKFKKYFEKFWDEDALKNAPKGFAKDHPHADWLRLKSFIVIHYFTDKEVLDKKFMKNLATVSLAGKPLNDFLNEAKA